MEAHFSSREANQNLARAKRAASNGPVFITDRGREGHVLLTRAHYDRIVARRKSLAEALSNPEVAEIDFDIPRLPDEKPRSVELD